MSDDLIGQFIGGALGAAGAGAMALVATFFSKRFKDFVEPYIGHVSFFVAIFSFVLLAIAYVLLDRKIDSLKTAVDLRIYNGLDNLSAEIVEKSVRDSRLDAMCNVNGMRIRQYSCPELSYMTSGTKTMYLCFQRCKN